MAKLQLNLNQGNNNQKIQEQNAQQNKIDIEQEERNAERMRKMEAEVRAHNKEKERKLNIYKRKALRTKIITTTLIILFMGSILGFGIYNTFFNKGIQMKDAVYAADAIQKASPINFPSAGVEGFLRENIDNILNGFIQQLPADKESMVYDTTSLYVTRVIPKTPTSCSSYFNMDILVKAKNSQDEEGNTIVGETTRDTYSFMLPVLYENNAYRVGGVPELVMRPTNNITSVSEAEYLKFNAGTEIDSTDASAARAQVETFLNNVYNTTSSVSTFYGGTVDEAEVIKRSAYGKEFVSVSDFRLYSEPNKEGYNAYVDYVIRIKSSGVTFLNRTYLLMESTGTNSNDWKVMRVL